VTSTLATTNANVRSHRDGSRARCERGNAREMGWRAETHIHKHRLEQRLAQRVGVAGVARAIAAHVALEHVRRLTAHGTLTAAVAYTSRVSEVDEHTGAVLHHQVGRLRAKHTGERLAATVLESRGGGRGGRQWSAANLTVQCDG
jgi:hypothetical protein